MHTIYTTLKLLMINMKQIKANDENMINNNVILPISSSFVTSGRNDVFSRSKTMLSTCLLTTKRHERYNRTSIRYLSYHSSSFLLLLLLLSLLMFMSLSNDNNSSVIFVSSLSLSSSLSSFFSSLSLSTDHIRNNNNNNNNNNRQLLYHHYVTRNMNSDDDKTTTTSNTSNPSNITLYGDSSSNNNNNTIDSNNNTNTSMTTTKNNSDNSTGTTPNNNKNTNTNSNSNSSLATSPQNDDAYQFVAFLLLYLFLVLCCVIPTCCAYRRRRNMEYHAALEQQQQHQIHLAEQFVQRVRQQQQQQQQLQQQSQQDGNSIANTTSPYTNHNNNNLFLLSSSLTNQQQQNNMALNPLTGFPFMIRSNNNANANNATPSSSGPIIADMDELRVERSRVFLQELKGTTMVVMNDHIKTHQNPINDDNTEAKTITEESDVETNTKMTTTSSALEHHTTYDEFVTNGDCMDEFHQGNTVTIRLDENVPNGNRSVPALCAICLCQYEEGDSISWSPDIGCQHVFHTDCIVEWLSKKQQSNNNNNHFNNLLNNNNNDNNGESKCPLCRLEYCPSASNSLQELDYRYYQSLHMQQMRQQQLAYSNYERALFQHGRGDLQFISTASFLESFTQALALSHFYRNDGNNNNNPTIPGTSMNTTNNNTNALSDSAAGATDGDVTNVTDGGSVITSLGGTDMGGGGSSTLSIPSTVPSTTTSATTAYGGMFGTTSARDGNHVRHHHRRPGPRRVPVVSILNPHPSASLSSSSRLTNEPVPGTATRRLLFPFNFRRNNTTSSNQAVPSTTSTLEMATPHSSTDVMTTTGSPSAAVLTYSRSTPPLPSPPYSRALDVFDNQGLLMLPTTNTNHLVGHNNNDNDNINSATDAAPIQNSRDDVIILQQPDETTTTAAATIPTTSITIVEIANPLSTTDIDETLTEAGNNNNTTSPAVSSSSTTTYATDVELGDMSHDDNIAVHANDNNELDIGDNHRN